MNKSEIVATILKKNPYAFDPTRIHRPSEDIKKMIRGDDILKNELLKNENIFPDGVAKYANITKKDKLKTLYKKYKKKYGISKKELENPTGSDYFIMNQPMGPYFYYQRIKHMEKIIKKRDPNIEMPYKLHHTTEDEKEYMRKNRLFNNTTFKTAKEEQVSMAKNKTQQINPAFF